MTLHKNRYWSLLGLAATALSLLLAMQMLGRHPLQAAANATQLRIEPAQVDLTPGRPVTITVYVADVQNLYGVQFDVLYDPQRVAIKSIAPSEFISPGFPVPGSGVYPAQGRAWLGFTRIAPTPPISGSGPVATLVLEPTDCSYATTLHLSDSILADQNGVAIPHTVASGAVGNTNTGGTRKIAGVIFHDSNANGVQEGNEQALETWPVFLQGHPFSAQPEQTVFSQASGNFQFDSLHCGNYQVWSQNGVSATPPQRVPLLAASDTLTVSIPITGALEYPFPRIFLPGIMRSAP